MTVLNAEICGCGAAPWMGVTLDMFRYYTSDLLLKIGGRLINV
jgi:hypothetical protein